MFFQGPGLTQRVILKLDLKNSFNSFRRDHLIETCIRRAPSVALLAHLAYSKPNILLAYDLPIDFRLNVWHLDYATMSDVMDSLVTDIISVTNSVCMLGLVINRSKSEIIALTSMYITSRKSYLTSRSLSLVPMIQSYTIMMQSADLSIFCSPIESAGVRRCFEESCSQLCMMPLHMNRIKPLQWLFLLTDCFAAPRSMFRLKSPRYFKYSDLPRRIESTLRRSSEKICSMTMDDIDWPLAKFPTRFVILSL